MSGGIVSIYNAALQSKQSVIHLHNTRYKMVCLFQANLYFLIQLVR